MKAIKIKRYRLSVSRTFPKTHPNAECPTWFLEAIKCGIGNECTGDCYSCGYFGNKKIHTIRSNYDLWSNRMADVKDGKAIIELCYWSGKPYRSKQVVFATLDKDSGCGVQELRFYYDRITEPFINTPEEHIGYIDKIDLIAQNDGLSLNDFKAWFKGADLSQPMAIIHFTSFRY